MDIPCFLAAPESAEAVLHGISSASPKAAARPPAVPGVDAESAALLIDRLRDEVREELRRRDIETIAVGARLDTEVRFRSRRDVGNRHHSGSSSETYIRAAEVDLAARPLSWLQGSLVLKSEYSGADTTNQNQPADPTPFLDEATLTLKSPEFPLYTVIGKRRQPFGVFFGDERWATDPMSKDAHEINQPGLTVGFFRKLLPSGLGLLHLLQGCDDLPRTAFVRLGDRGRRIRTPSPDLVRGDQRQCRRETWLGGGARTVDAPGHRLLLRLCRQPTGALVDRPAPRAQRGGRSDPV